MKEKIKPDFLIIPFKVIENSQHLEAKIYGVIYWLAKLKEGKCIASNNYLSEVCNCTSGSVRNSLTNLEKSGFIKRTYKDKEKNIRDRIIPLVCFDGVSSTDYRVSSDNDRGVSLDNAHISKSNLKEKKNTIPFDSFWNLYDKKVDKYKCELKWKKLSEKEKQEIIKNAPLYKQAHPTKKYRKNPLTYLNGRCWEDEIQVNKVIRIR
jgi:hypothetical protein